MTYFRNRVVLVTGAASGIGRALGTALARARATVVLTDVDGDGVEGVGAILRGGGLTVETERLDVTDAGAMKRTVDRIVETHGRLDLLFNNAGIAIAGRTELLDLEEDWRRVLDVNLNGVIHGVQAAYPQMIRQRFGHIVNVASMAGYVPLPYVVTYSTAKHAVVGLSTSLALEAQKHGVSVSVVCPGYIDTPIFDRTKYVGLDREKALRALPVAPTSPERAAQIILAGVEKKKRVIPVTRFAHALWLANRAVPGLVAKLLELQVRRLDQ